MSRTFAACSLPAVALCVSWLRLESPRAGGQALAVLVLALAPALLPRSLHRGIAAVLASAGAISIAFGAQPWELLPFRDERVIGPVAGAVRRGLNDFYGVLVPLDPQRNPAMHTLVLVAIFGFVLAVSLLVAARLPLWAAAVTVAGVGWPATLLGGRAIAIGALALAAALSIPLVLRVRPGPALLAGAATATLIVSGAALTSSATELAPEAALNWQSWDLRGKEVQATGVGFIWDSNYDGIRFPATRTTVLTVEGPSRAQYWRTSTLDLFSDDHWFEELFWLARLDRGSAAMRLDSLMPARAARRQNWLEQKIEVKALVDDHLAAAGTPVALDSSRMGTVFQLSGGVLRVRDPLGRGQSYRVWSYAPDPAPAALVSSPPRYPAAALRHLELHGRVFPAFGVRGRNAMIRALFDEQPLGTFALYRRVYEAARRVAGGQRTPYTAVLALESWFRQRGGFVYDEQPPRLPGPPLVNFVTKARAGYCQHYAGAMALMLRMLGVPARVAVGFTSGTFRDGKWVVTDREAHAWVEVWFEGEGWVPFDPTPGRGTFAGTYSFASDSEEAVAALRRGQLDSRSGPPRERAADIPLDETSSGGRGMSLFSLVLGLGVLWVLGVGIGKDVLRRSRHLTRDPRRAATASRRELEAFLRDQGIAVPPSTTLDTLQNAVRQELGVDGRRFAQAAARARFGSPDEAWQSAGAARQELRALLKRARDELSLWARFRGFVSLRSLRGGAST